MQPPRQWTESELARDAADATADFRRRRLDEPLEQYTRFFEEFCRVFQTLIERLPDIRQDDSALADVMVNDQKRTAFRYLGAPPISEDDLKTLADSRLSPV